MPSFWTHLAFAKDCERRLRLPSADGTAESADRKIGCLTDAILAHPHAFYTGMQGPDLFLFYLPAAFYRRRLSKVLHTEETAKLLCRLFAHAHKFRGEDRRRALAYVSGFLGHYLLDSHTHAFVYARAGIGQSADSFYKHNALEADLNRLAVRRSLNCRLADLPRPRSYKLCSGEQRILSQLLSGALQEVYRIRCSPEKVYRALWSVNFCTQLLYDPSGNKAKFAQIIERPLGDRYLSPLFLGESHFYADPANLLHRAWRDPYTGRMSHASFFQLYDRALDRFVPAIRRLESPDLQSCFARRTFFEKLCRRDFHGEPISVSANRSR